MSVTVLTVYVLTWPVIVIGVLGVIVTSFTREVRKAKREGRQII